MRTRGNPDALTLDEFERELLQFTQRRPFVPVANPLEHVVRLIATGPALPGSRLLLRVLVALAARRGEFRYAEVGALDSEAISTVVQLMQSRRTGSLPDNVWALAVENARTSLAAP
ncbi:MAG: hypothetical protein GC151_10040 [Betaproteobacteria bacterium]|nr:hypothetical protein [Betaproteobacteria bacterium]